VKNTETWEVTDASAPVIVAVSAGSTTAVPGVSRLLQTALRREIGLLRDR